MEKNMENFDLLDDDGYPTQQTLETIENWDARDFDGLIEYVRQIWKWEYGWENDGKIVKMSTGGWSGNEEIVGSMRANVVWWALYWFSSERGGHYVFEKRIIK